MTYMIAPNIEANYAAAPGTQSNVPFESGAEIVTDLKEFMESSYMALDRDDI
jgi:hypothetical protein